MTKASLLILVFNYNLGFGEFQRLRGRGAMGSDNVDKKRYETESKVVLKRAGRKTSLLKHGNVSFEETLQTHRLIQRKMSNEHQTNTRGSLTEREMGSSPFDFDRTHLQLQASLGQLELRRSRLVQQVEQNELQAQQVLIAARDRLEIQENFTLAGSRRRPDLFCESCLLLRSKKNSK